MDSLREVFEDWTEIDTAKRLRGAILHAARIIRRNGDDEKAREYEARVRYMPRRMCKESINYVLMAICLENDLIS